MLKRHRALEKDKNIIKSFVSENIQANFLQSQHFQDEFELRILYKDSRILVRGHKSAINWDNDKKLKEMIISHVNRHDYRYN